MTTKLYWLGLLLVSCGGRAASSTDPSSESGGEPAAHGGASAQAGSTGATSDTSSAGTSGSASGATATDPGNTTIIVRPDADGGNGTDANPLIKPGGLLGTCDNGVQCEPNLTCIQPFADVPSYHVCSFLCTTPDAPSTVDPERQIQCELRYGYCRTENPPDQLCIPFPPNPS